MNKGFNSCSAACISHIRHISQLSPITIGDVNSYGAACESSGSETEIYCYNAQNRLVWAGSNGTPPSAGSGTCGTGTPSNTLSGANYSDSYVYTHQGQLWQGSYNGKGAYQYLYCNSSQPHQLTGLYPVGTTCSTTSGQTQTYAASYDSWGNMTNRTATGTGGTTATLIYDAQDHLVRWNDTVTSSNEAWYMYDASGQRVLYRAQSGTGNSNTTNIVYAFGLEDHTYDGSGTNLYNKYYYSVAGRLIGVLTNNGTNDLLTDALGSVLATINNTLNSASIQGNQVFGPYGASFSSKGKMNTTRGYTGQYADALTQLDYYNARYYDPMVGVFISADVVQGNLEGMNPYGYVGENPETKTDPTGKFYAPGTGGGGTNQLPPQKPPQQLTLGESSLSQYENQLIAMRTWYAVLRLGVDYYFGNHATTVKDLVTIATALNFPAIDDTKLVTAWTGLVDKNQGPVYGLFQQAIGDKAISGILSGAAKVFDIISIAYFLMDIAQNRDDGKRMVADALSAAAFALDLFRKPLSQKLSELGVDEQAIDSVILFLGAVSVALQIADAFPPPSNQGNNDNHDRRKSFGGGGGFGGFPPLLPMIPLPATQPNPYPEGQAFPGLYPPYPGLN